MSDNMLSDIPNIPGIVFGKLGDELKINEVEKYKAIIGHNDVISVINNNILFVGYHYIPELGYYIYCYGGMCCKKASYDFPIKRVVLPIVQYSTDKEGNILDGNVEIKIFSLPSEKYNSLVMKSKILEKKGKDIYNCDLIITPSEKKPKDIDYVDFTYDILNEEFATWKKSEKYVQQVKEGMKIYKLTYIKKIASRIENDEELLRKISEKNKEESNNSLGPEINLNPIKNEKKLISNENEVGTFNVPDIESIF